MRQTDFAVGKARRSRSRWLRNLRIALCGDTPNPLRIKTLRRYQEARWDIRHIRLRSIKIKSHYFNLNVFSKEAALRDFRFIPTHIPIISSVIGWTTGRTKRNRYTCDLVTATCIVLRRLAAPCRWKDLELVFGMEYSVMSEVFWEVLEKLVAGRGHLLTSLRENLLKDRATQYADAIRAKGAPLDSCVGFIDCCKIRMSRPRGHGSLQRSCYSGHKRMHCLIYQTVTTPDGLLFHMYGPEVGRRHDTTLLRQSELEEKLEECLLIDGRRFYVYGDAPYMLRTWLQTAFDRLNANDAQAEYNKLMSALRIAVEWNYKDVKQMWATNDYARMLKVRKARVALLYIASTLLYNFKTCIEGGGQVVAYFKCMPPRLNEYINST